MDPFSFAIMTVAQIGIGFLFPAEGPRLKDLKVAASTYGAAIPNAYGVVRVAANMIWTDKIREHKKKKRVGLKRYKYYLYTGTFAMAMCRGPIANVRKIWANHKLIYDATGTGTLAIKKKFNIKIYKGDEDQQPDPTIEKIVGEGNTPAYRGLSYLMFEDMPLEDFGNSIPQISVELYAVGDGEGSSIGRVTRLDFRQATSYQTDEVVYNGDLDMVITGLTYSGLAVLRPSSGKEESRSGHTKKEFQAVLGISPTTGNVLVQSHGLYTGSSSFYLYEPVNWSVVGSFGRVNDPNGEYPSMGREGAFCVDRSGTEWCFYTSLFGSHHAFQTTALGMGGLIPCGSRPNGLYGSSAYIGVSGQEKPTFYVFEGGDSSSSGGVSEVRLRRVEGSGSPWTPTTVMTIPNTENRAGFRVETCHYDPTDQGLLLIWRDNSTTYMGKYRPAENRWAWRRSGFPAAITYVNPTVLTRGEFWWVSNNRLWRMNAATGEYLRDAFDPFMGMLDTDNVPQSVIDAAITSAPYTGEMLYDQDNKPVTGFSASTQQHIDPANEQIILYGTGTGGSFRIVRRAIQVKDESTTLAGLVSLLLARAGLGPQDYDVTALRVQPIRGYGWANFSDLRGILAQLRMLFMFDLVERNGKLVGVMRATGSNEDRTGEPVRRITSRLLGSTGDGGGTDFWKESRIQDADLPRRVALSYMNWERDFETSTALTKRITSPSPTMFSFQQVSMEIGVVLTPKEAKDQVNKILWSQWAERTEHETAVPWAYLDLDPADIVDVRFDDGRRYRERLQEMEFGANWALRLESITQDSIAYESDAKADGGSGGPPPGPYIPPRAAKAVVLNTPLLRDQDDTGGAYSLYYTGVAHGGLVPFDGASMYRSTDNASYEMLYVTDQSVEWASVAGVVPAPRHGAFGLDWETKITVWPVIDWFELESITDDELWAGQNLCAVGAELIQFRDCVQNADGSWTIWNLLRGRRGTEYACKAHQAGEMFVYLSSETFEGDAEALDQRARSRWFRAVADGISPDLSPATKIFYEPRDLMPYAPKDIRRSVAGTTITLSWKRRTRMGGNMQDGTGSVPLNEGREWYEVYILNTPFLGDLSRSDDPPLDSAVIHRLETAESEIQLETTEFTAPFDVNLDTLHVLIYQHSTAVGRGFPAVRSIESWQDF